VAAINGCSPRYFAERNSPRRKKSNNRTENSHQPTQMRERKQQRLKSVKSARRFLSTFTAFHNHFIFQRRLIP